MSAPKPRRIVMAVGWTAGHVHPSLAVAQAYRVRMPGTEVTYLGCVEGPAAGLVAREGDAFVAVPGAPVVGRRRRERVRALGRTVAGFGRAREVLGRLQPHLVLGFGSYPTVGVGLAARSLGIPLVLHEANARVGLANQVLASLADRLLVGWPEARRGRFQDAEVVGHPVRGPIVASVAGEDGPTGVLLTGGSLGDDGLNRFGIALMRQLADAGAELRITHQTGEADFEATARAYARLGLDATVVTYLHDLVGIAASADLVVSSAGAGTLAELSMLGIPAVVVPRGGPHREHQRANAEAFQRRAHWARVVDPDSSPRAIVGDVLERLGTPRASIESAPEGVAADRIVEICERVARRG